MLISSAQGLSHSQPGGAPHRRVAPAEPRPVRYQTCLSLWYHLDTGAGTQLDADPRIPLHRGAGLEDSAVLAGASRVLVLYVRRRHLGSCRRFRRGPSKSSPTSSSLSIAGGGGWIDPCVLTAEAALVVNWGLGNTRCRFVSPWGTIPVEPGEASV